MGTNESCKFKNKILVKLNDDESNNNCSKIKTNIKSDVKYRQNLNMICADERNEISEAFASKKHRSRLTSRSANSLFLLLRISKQFKTIVKYWMLFLVWISCVSAYKEQRFAIEPQDQVRLHLLFILYYLYETVPITLPLNFVLYYLLLYIRTCK